MTWRRIGSILIALPLVAIVGLAILFAGLKGSSNYAESLCAGGSDGRPAYGGYSMSGEIWPPEFTCEITGNGVPPIVERHRFAAWGMLVAIVVVPLWYLISVFVGIWWFLIRRQERDPWITPADVSGARP
ncbi:MAG: hypothetical protein ABIP17_11825 [Ilumatobacteraceae bacterium]